MTSLKKLALLVPVLGLSSIVSPLAARAADTDDAAPFSGKPPAPGAFAPVTAPGGGFGTVGQWVISTQSANAASAGFQLRGSSGGGGWGLNIHPALDTFIINNVSVGGEVGFGHGGGASTFDVGARAGYALAVVDRVAFWPTAGLFFSYTTGNHMSSSDLSLGVFAPFLYVPAPHFFVGLGPTFNAGLTGGGGQDYGLDFTIGGWI